MRHIIIKEGEYRPNAFSNLVETVNADYAEQVGFFTRIDYALRLTRNRSTTNPHMPLAIAHYHIDPAAPQQSPEFFRPIDTELMITALEKYNYVLFGVVTKQHMLNDYKLIHLARYIARTDDGKLIDLETQELLNPTDKSVTFMTSFFGIVRMKGLPVYQLILDPKLVHATDGFDYYHSAADTMYTLINDFDGYVRDNVFNVQIHGGQAFDSTVLASPGGVVSFEFFGGRDSILRDEDGAKIFAGADCTVSAPTADVTYNGSRVIIDVYQQFTPVTISFNCGKFYDIASAVERPVFKYLIVKP